MRKPNIQSQLQAQTGMGRPGGMMSAGSSPGPSSQGKAFAAMEATLLRKKKPSPKKLAPGGGKQFKTLTSQ